jgi:hypothetical protein
MHDEHELTDDERREMDERGLAFSPDPPPPPVLPPWSRPSVEQAPNVWRREGQYVVSCSPIQYAAGVPTRYLILETTERRPAYERPGVGLQPHSAKRGKSKGKPWVADIDTTFGASVGQTSKLADLPRAQSDPLLALVGAAAWKPKPAEIVEARDVIVPLLPGMDDTPIDAEIAEVFYEESSRGGDDFVRDDVPTFDRQGRRMRMTAQVADWQTGEGRGGWMGAFREASGEKLGRPPAEEWDELDEDDLAAVRAEVGFESIPRRRGIKRDPGVCVALARYVDNRGWGSVKLLALAYEMPYRTLDKWCRAGVGTRMVKEGKGDSAE